MSDLGTRLTGWYNDEYAVALSSDGLWAVIETADSLGSRHLFRCPSNSYSKAGAGNKATGNPNGQGEGWFFESDARMPIAYGMNSTVTTWVPGAGPSLSSTPSGCSIASNSESGLKPSRSLKALGTTMRPDLSIFSSMPFTLPYAIKYGKT